jgi:hypothetical protein
MSADWTETDDGLWEREIYSINPHFSAALVVSEHAGGYLWSVWFQPYGGEEVCMRENVWCATLALAQEEADEWILLCGKALVGDQ